LTIAVSNVSGLSAEAAPASDPRPVVVRVQGLGKRFKIYQKPLDRLLEWVGAARRHSEFWAVRGVSFDVRQGECLGIIGANGSGKSTLLKIITGALQHTEGSYEVRGRVLSLIELGTGLNPLLSGRANVFNAAALLGFPANFAKDRIADIEAFAELGEFFERPVMLYSSGMKVRLAFSMFACFQPEVLIVDEALSVGDVFFQQKCATRIQELLEGGMTMILVSHDQGAILNLCDQAILLDQGHAIFSGTPAEALHRYSAHLYQKPRFSPRTREAAPAPAVRPSDTGDAERIIRGNMLPNEGVARMGNGDVRIVALRIAGPDDRETMQSPMGKPLTLEVLVEARTAASGVRVGMHLYDRFNTLVFAAGTFQVGHELPDLEAGERLIVRLEVTLDVHPGEYTFGVGTSLPSETNVEHGVVCDRITPLGPLIVVQDRDLVRPFYGMARLPLRASHARCGGEA
jgi:ABC-type polysaccharide/polyol phosphate transport system ATPase subunit